MLLNQMKNMEKQWKKVDRDGTRTHNPPARNRVPYPFGHAAINSKPFSIVIALCEKLHYCLYI